jgi:hypothetical protein
VSAQSGPRAAWRDRGSLSDAVERAVWGGLLSGVVATALLVARNGLAPTQHPLTFGWVFGGWFAAAGVAGALALALLLLGVARLLRRPSLAPALVSWISSGAAAWVWWSNARGARMAFALQGPVHFRLLLPAALVLAASALALLALATLVPGRRPVKIAGRALGLLALLGVCVALAPERYFAAARGSGASGAGVTAPAQLSALPPVFVIGLDGADWRHLEPLLARGELPHLAALRERGAWGPLDTIQPTLSPAVWTTIATGRPPFRHGIEGFTTPRLRGVEDSLPGLHPLRGVGFGALWRRLEASGRIRQAPVTSRDRAVPAFWNLAGTARSPVAVVHWWATWPAEPVFGFVVSDRAFAQGRTRDVPREHGLTFPPELFRRIAPDIARYDEITPAEARAFMDVSDAEFTDAARHGRGHPGDVVRELPYFQSLFESARRHALALADLGRRTWGTTPDLMVIFRLIDQSCHVALQHSELVEAHPESSPEQRRRFGRVVSEAYRRADRVVGELLAACGAACNVVVLSDHGFELEQFPGGLRRYHHAHTSPPGILLAAGPAFAPGRGRVEGLSVYDVLPLLAYLKGLPLARDLNGRLPVELLAPELLAAQPPREVDTYGTRAAPADLASGVEAVDEEMLERLRALGYIQ